jgi:hypothetical protein
MKPKTDKIENRSLGYRFTYIMLFIFSIVVASSFVLHACFKSVQGLPIEWLIAYTALLSWYVGENQWLRNGKHKPKKFPGEIFVGIAWTVYIILPFLKMINVVSRTSPYLTPYFLGVTTIYAGSKFIKYYRKGFRFFGKNITS